MLRYFLYIILTTLFLQTSIGQDNENVISKAFQGLPSQQKVYLHLDKNEYHAGDNVWFKAYIIKTDTHKPDTVETTLFVEVLSNNSTLIGKKILHTINGYAYGDIKIPDSINPGNYHIRAYTNRMLNFSEEFIFEKFFFIHNPIGKNIISRREILANRRINRELEKREENFSIEFYPEGGNLVSGIRNRVAFYAFNELQKGVPIKGFIKNSEGENVVSLETIFQGKGIFEWTPVENMSYSAHVIFPDQKRKTIPIREITNKGYNLRVNLSGEGAEVVVNSKGNGLQSRTYLVIHNRGEIQQMTQLNESQLPFSLSLQQKEPTPGISVATLFSAQAEVLAERLFFIPPPTEREIRFELDRFSDEYYDLKLNVKEFSADSATYSVSVVASSQKSEPAPDNILSYVFLTSELTKLIQNPTSYLGHGEFLERADLLMMVSQWKRYRLSNVMNEESKIPAFNHYEKGFPVYGIITPTEESLKTGKTTFDVTLSYGEEGRVFITNTDNEGRFGFRGIEEHGEFKAEISVSGIRRSAPEYMELFPERIGKVEQMLNFQSRKLITRGTSGWRFRKSSQPAGSDRIIKLGGASGNTGYGQPSQTIYLRENDTRFQNMRDVLSKSVSGLLIDGNNITIRGKSSIQFSNQPLMMVDGSQLSAIQFLQIPLIELSRIEVYKGTNASIFGIRGTNGAILAYSRRGRISEKIIINYIMDGYYIPRGFPSSGAQLKEVFFEEEKYKQTIFWLPYLNLNNNGNATLRLPMEHVPPYINVIIEGIDAEGNITHARQEFDLHEPNP